MKIIIPMAGKGTRLRPHTHTTPKPLLMVGGKIMLEEILDTLVSTLSDKVDEICFVLGDFNKDVRLQLTDLIKKYQAKTSFVVQDPPLGTAHAIYMAKDFLSGPVLIVYADTLFNADLSNLQQEETDGFIWTKSVDNPSMYGVVVEDQQGYISSFVEKPSEPVSNKAIIGLYYFKEGETLKTEVQKLIDEEIMVKGEFQLTDALTALLSKGSKFQTRPVDYWLDCGNEQSLLNANKYLLDLKKPNYEISKYENTVIIPPVSIHETAIVRNSVIGPYVSVAEGVELSYAIVENAIINKGSRVARIAVSQSIIGQQTEVTGRDKTINIGDHSKVIFQ